MRYVLQAVLSNAQHPEYGQATIPFPIPNQNYDSTIELLGPLEIGDTLRQDCQVDELDSFYIVFLPRNRSSCGKRWTLTAASRMVRAWRKQGPLCCKRRQKKEWRSGCRQHHSAAFAASHSFSACILLVVVNSFSNQSVALCCRANRQNIK